MQNDPGWEKITEAIDLKFGLTGHGSHTEPLEDRHDLTQHVRFIEFERSGQKFRLERITKPAVIDRKSIHGKAANAAVRFENIYDLETTTAKTVYLHWANGEWQELDGDGLASALA